MIDDLTSRLNIIKSGNYTYQDKNKIIIDEERYILTFKKIMNVITLRTESHSDKPPMYIYGNGYFIKGAETYFTETNQKIFGSSMTRHLNSEFLHKLQSWSYDDADYFECFNPDLLNVQNGVLNLRTKELMPHDPKYRMTSILPVKYAPDTDYGFINDLVYEMVDKSDLKVIQEIFGDCLYRDYWLQKAFMLIGSGANGKGVLLYCLMKMLGIKNCSSINLVALTNDKFKAAELYHKYANISNETPSRTLTSTDRFKSLRGGDLIPAERKFGQPFQFINYAKMIFSANKIPPTSDYTFGFWRSWILVKFPNIFVGTDANKNLKYELTDTPEKLSGILNYAIEGLHRLFEQKEFSYSKSSKEVEEEWKRSADPTLTFIFSCIKSDKNGKVKTDDILGAYFKTCSKYRLKPDSELGFWKGWNRVIKNDYKEIYPYAEKKQLSGGGSGTYYWKGIELLDLEQL